MGGIADPMATTVAVNVTEVPDATLPDTEAWSFVKVFARATARDAGLARAQAGLPVEEQRGGRSPRGRLREAKRRKRGMARRVGCEQGEREEPSVL